MFFGGTTGENHASCHFIYYPIDTQRTIVNCSEPNDGKRNGVSHFWYILIAICLVSLKGSGSTPGSFNTEFLGNTVSGYFDEKAALLAAISNTAETVEITSLPPSSSSGNLTPQTLQTIQDTFIIPNTSLASDIADNIAEQGNKVIDYEVQEGDTISQIASDFRVSVNAIIWANKLANINAIQPGMILQIPPVTGVIHVVQSGDTVSTIAQKYGAEQDKIIEFNGLPLSGDLQVGQQVIVPDGTMPSAARGTPRTAVASITSRFDLLPKLPGYFLMPTSGTRTQGLHGRNGIDVANSCGTPLLAAAEGTVTVAKLSGWNGGYGDYVKITHPNGTETLYSHMSKVFVRAGQYVSQGFEIGKMGTTGRSTGCHLHFEVHGAQNPLATLSKI